jgi:uncharacterized protein
MTEAEKQNNGNTEQPAEPAEKKKTEQIQLRLETTKDKLAAFLTLITLTKTARVPLDKIKNTMAEKGITYGIKEAVLDELAEKPVFNKRILIAQGKTPKPGKDGSIDFEFDTDKPARVAPGQRLGEIHPAVDGQEGVNIFGEPVEVDDVIAATVPVLVNADFSPEDSKVLVSTIDGYAFFEPDSIKIQPFFSMDQVSDQYEASVKITPRRAPDDFGPDDLRKYLQEAGIVFGVLDDVIEWAFKEEKFEQPLLVAKGQPPVDATNGELIFYFDSEIKPKFDDDGNVNFKELNLIQNVRKGDKLAEVTEPVPGKEGKTIYGETSEPGEGVKPELPSGDNIVRSPDNPDLLLADIDGTVRKVKDSVSVDPVFAVKGDIDYSVGNIDFVGSVVISGDVKSGFRVKATGDVEVNGIVEDAVIESEGNVLLKMGFIGHGEGKIIAKGNVSAKYCVNQHIVCQGDVNIGEYFMHSNVQAGGMLIVTEKKGLIVGGEYCALKGIEANILGNENFVHTSIIAGVDRETGRKIKELRTRLWQNAEHLKEINKILNKYSRRRLVKKPLPPDRLELIDTLNKIKEKKLQIATKLGTEIKDMESADSICEEASIKAYDVIYPGVAITLCNRHVKVEDPLKSVVYRYSENGVVMESLNEEEEVKTEEEEQS